MVDLSALRGHIAQLSGRQWGHVTRAQLLELGSGSSTIGQWVHTGKLVPVHVGVYAVGYRRAEPIARACAAVLACGEGAVLSHDSALALHGLRRWPRDPEVITRGHVRRAGIRTHRSRTLTAGEVTRQSGIPVTRAARAITDIRGRLTERQRIRLVNRGRLDHLITSEEAERLLRHRRNPTRSHGEDDLQRWLERHGFPQPLINVRAGGREVDALFPDARLIVELDAYATHGDEPTWTGDHVRDLEHLADDDLTTVRLTGELLTDTSAERLWTLLRRRRRASRPPSPDPPGC